MTLRALNPESTERLSVLVEESIDRGSMSLLLLFEDRLETLPEEFLSAYLRSREERNYDFVVTLRGELIDDEAGFFREVRQAVPLADYMGSNFNAVADVYRVEALSRDPSKRTYWVWRNAHALYNARPSAFAEAFEVLSTSARQTSAGFTDMSGVSKHPWPGWTPQRVILILTATWGAMGKEAANTDSFLYRLPPKWSTLFRDRSTSLTPIRFRKSSPE